MTFLSLAIAGAFIAVSKTVNPEMNIKPVLMMFGGVALGCFILTFVVGRKRDDD
ncbi:MAG: small integral membrane protein 8 [Synergistaceae bacterium]|jgi:VIT1/CCC1 family predicted Fe2+/Mn2+ transporter|nr:small integral membrane protein 8 [Synergistaceae bacterium]